MPENIADNAALFFDLGAQGRPAIISVVGAGGKTSLIFWLARLFRAAGRRVLIAATTHMFLPAAGWPVLFCRHPAALPARWLNQPQLICFAAWLPTQGKARGFAPAAIDALAARSECDLILVEADGARGLPLKAPAEHEPCIPQSSCCVIAVAGGQMLGRVAGPEWVHRWPRFAAITGLTADEPLALRHLIRLARHPQGAFKGAPPACRRIWLLNRFSHSEKAREHELRLLLRGGDVDTIWLGAVRERPAMMRRLTR